jgi:long-chain acyl-CoA synthetase
MNYFVRLKYQSEQQGDKLCAIIENTSHTYGEICRLAEKMADELPNLEGCALLINSKKLLFQMAAFFGVQAKNIVPIIAHYDLPLNSLKGIMQKNGLMHLLTDEKIADDDFVEMKATEQGILYSLKDVVLKKTPSDACMGTLSSGSTDVPKVLYRTYESWHDFFPEQNRVFKIGWTSRIFLEGSLSFTGNLNLLADAIDIGATVIMTDEFRCNSWLKMIERYEADVIYMVPAKLRVMARALRFNLYKSVKMILCGSQILEVRTGKAILASMVNADIILYYGASELNYISYLNYVEMLQHENSVGRPFRGVGVSVNDGLLYVDSPYFVCGMARPATVNDVGEIDAEGYIIFGGRKERIINKGGYKVNCLKVENALKENKFIHDAVVMGYENGSHGMETAAFIVAKQPLARKMVLGFLKVRLAPQELPKQLIYVQEIPLNSLGKVNSDKLRELIKK